MSLHRFSSNGDANDEDFEEMLVYRALAFAVLLQATRELQETAIVEIANGNCHFRGSQAAMAKIRASLIARNPKTRFVSMDRTEGDNDDS